MNKQPTERSPEHELIFRIWNSYWLECIAEKFNRRIDTVINATTALLNKSELADRIAPVGTPVMRFGRYAAYPTASSGSAL